MITNRERKLSVIMIVVQVLLTIFVFFITQFIYPQREFTYIENTILLIQIIVIWGFLLKKLNLGIIFRQNLFKTGLRDYIVLIFFGTLIFYLEIKLNLFFHDTGHSFRFIILFGIIDFLVLIIFKFLFYYMLRYLRRKGRNIRNIIFIADSTNNPFINHFVEAKDWGYKILAVVTKDQNFNCSISNLDIIQEIENLKDYMVDQPIDDIFYCLPIDDMSFDIEQIVAYSNEIGIALHIIQNNYPNSIVSNGNSKKLINKFITFKKTQHNYYYLKVKDIIDLLGSIIVSIISLPIMFIIAVLIKLEDGGPVFFKQERIGLNGRRFNCYKFRSMVVNAEALIDQLQDKNESDGPTFKIKHDPRVTKIGRFLRKTSLDELPQFYNVMKGEMSIVGPRPPLLKEVHLYERPQLRRLSMKPGITCIWQVKGRNKVSFIEWMKMDLEYIDQWSLWLDLKIMAATVGVVLKANGQ